MMKQGQFQKNAFLEGQQLRDNYDALSQLKEALEMNRTERLLFNVEILVPCVRATDQFDAETELRTNHLL